MSEFRAGPLLAGLVLALLLAGCGQQGPLYLPKSPASPPASDPAPPRP